MKSPPSSNRTPGTDKQAEEINVGIGELASTRGPAILRTLVGSCIALAIYDRNIATGGLAHIVHPQSPIPQANSASPITPGKYADTAITELVSRIIQLGGNTRRLSAKFAGGAKMFAQPRTNSVGEQNLAQVIDLLNKANIPILGRDCGGKHGRRISFDLSSGRMFVETVGQPTIEL